jgi:hypothetical protein
VPGPSLYSKGWRQGSMFEYGLALNSVVLGAAGAAAQQPSITRRALFRSIQTTLARLSRREPLHGEQGPVLHSSIHDFWVVCSQDCTLDQNGIEESEPVIELRPVLTENPPTDWGIRARKFLLDQSHYVDDYAPRTSISPTALNHIGEQGHLGKPLTSDRALYFKTWLGVRYDRPAVPPDRLELAQQIAQAVRALRQPAIPAVRDVLMQFGPGNPPDYALVAVVLDPADKPLARKWLADVAFRVPRRLGTPSRLEAVTTNEASLHLVENSYAADVSQITWRRGGPQGAH